MQIQRTGYQQNFGSPTVIGTRNKALTRALLALDEEVFAKTTSPQIRIGDLSQKKDRYLRVLLLDEIDKVHKPRLALVPADAEFRPDNEDDFHRTLREFSNNPATRHIEVSSLGELLVKIPTLSPFTKQLLEFFASKL